MIHDVKYFVFTALTIICFTGCKKEFLEVVPVGQQVASETNDYDLLMNDVRFYYVSTGGWQDATLMGEDIAVDNAFFSQTSQESVRLFEWQADIYLPGTFDTDLIDDQSEKLFTVNKVINEVMGSGGGTEAEKKRILAEALATRAMLNFNFINYYAKPYNAATAIEDPGYPIIMTADVSEIVFERGTVAEMYDFIISDLTEAAANLPEKSVFPTRWSSAAAKAFLAKVYVFMGKYSDALPLLNESLTSIESAGTPSLYDYNVELAPGGSFLPIDPTFGPSSGPGNDRYDFRESALGISFYNGFNGGNIAFGTNGVLLSPETQALYTPSDLRLLLYTDAAIDGNPNPHGALRKYGVSYSKQGLQLPDIYLLRAECRARTNNLPGAVSDLEWLRKHRMPPTDAAVPSGIAADAEALTKFVINERTREFAAEGMRWFDMRRLLTDPLFESDTYKHFRYNTDGTTDVFTLDKPNRLVMRFPVRVMQSNPISLIIPDSITALQ